VKVKVKVKMAVAVSTATTVTVLTEFGPDVVVDTSCIVLDLAEYRV
jgi:hypothetical protein